MTVKIITRAKKFIGLSTDTKPTTDIYVGSEFYETDTGQNWKYDGDNWIEDLTIINAIDKAIS